MLNAFGSSSDMVSTSYGEEKTYSPETSSVTRLNRSKFSAWRIALRGSASIAAVSAILLLGVENAWAQDITTGMVDVASLGDVSDVRVLADGSVELTLADGSKVVVPGDDVLVSDGVVMVDATVLEGLGVDLAVGTAGVGLQVPLILGALGLAGAGVAVASSGGTDDVAPSFTSEPSASVSENVAAGTSVLDVVATDTDGDALTYFISGGADADLFEIDASTGALSFLASPDFETPGDAGGDNVYDIIVTASDGTNSADQAVAITVTDANDNSPVFTSGATASVEENTTLVVYTAAATDADAGTSLTYSLSGADAGLFTIDANTGEVSFINAPDFENPGDAGANNVYDIVVTASDGTNSTDQSVAITVTDANDNSPVFSSGATASVEENATSVVYTAAATDSDAGTTLTYSLSGTDASLFTIDADTGEVSFINAPDFENPGDAGGDNAYDIIVTASDGTNSTDQTVAITVTDINESSPVITSSATASVEENVTGVVYTAVATDADTAMSLTYSLSGTDASLFTIDADTGEVSFTSSPDFETPGDAGGDNVYDIIVTASDGTNSVDQSVAITVTDVNDNNPVFSSGATASAAENIATVVYTAAATDADAGTTLTYSLSGTCLLYTSPSPRDGLLSRMPSSA